MKYFLLIVVLLLFQEIVTKDNTLQPSSSNKDAQQHQQHGQAGDQFNDLNLNQHQHQHEQQHVTNDNPTVNAGVAPQHQHQHHHHQQQSAFNMLPSFLQQQPQHQMEHDDDDEKVAENGFGNQVDELDFRMAQREEEEQERAEVNRREMERCNDDDPEEKKSSSKNFWSILQRFRGADASTTSVQNQCISPRQQEQHAMDPELMRFRASQRLLNAPSAVASSSLLLLSPLPPQQQHQSQQQQQQQAQQQQAQQQQAQQQQSQQQQSQQQQSQQQQAQQQQQQSYWQRYNELLTIIRQGSAAAASSLAAPAYAGSDDEDDGDNDAEYQAYLDNNQGMGSSYTNWKRQRVAQQPDAATIAQQQAILLQIQMSQQMQQQPQFHQPQSQPPSTPPTASPPPTTTMSNPSDAATIANAAATVATAAAAIATAPTATASSREAAAAAVQSAASAVATAAARLPTAAATSAAGPTEAATPTATSQTTWAAQKGKTRKGRLLLICRAASNPSQSCRGRSFYAFYPGKLPHHSVSCRRCEALKKPGKGRISKKYKSSPNPLWRVRDFTQFLDNPSTGHFPDCSALTEQVVLEELRRNDGDVTAVEALMNVSNNGETNVADPVADVREEDDQRALSFDDINNSAHVADAANVENQLAVNDENRIADLDFVVDPNIRASMPPLSPQPLCHSTVAAVFQKISSSMAAFKARRISGTAPAASAAPAAPAVLQPDADAKTSVDDNGQCHSTVAAVFQKISSSMVAFKARRIGGAAPAAPQPDADAKTSVDDNVHSVPGSIKEGDADEPNVNGNSSPEASLQVAAVPPAAVAVPPAPVAVPPAAVAVPHAPVPVPPAPAPTAVPPQNNNNDETSDFTFWEF